MRKLALVVLLLAGPSLAPAADGPLVAPGRVAELEGSLLLLPAGWDEWRESELNSALAAGDWLRSSHDSSASLELSPSLLVHLAPRSELRLDRQEGVLVLELLDGSLVACIGEDAEAASLVTRQGSAWLEPGGFYRVDAGSRSTRLVVAAGYAEVERHDRVRSVGAGRLAELSSGSSKPRVRRSGSEGWDAFSAAAHEACGRLLGDESELRLVGARDLELDGEWVLVAGRRHWRPLGLPRSWAPFGDGCFRWHPTWGWYFVPRYRWGWVTHHHGWWSWHDHWGWIWYPDDWWHPHRVRFRIVDDSVYWCPRTRDRDRDRDGADGKDPQRGWSRAPVAEFGDGPIVRVRPPLGGGELSRLRPDDGDAPAPVDPPGRLQLPPLPPRASEPGLATRRPLPARLPVQRLTRPGGLVPPATVPPSTGETLRPVRPAAPAGPAPERSPVVRPPARPELPAPRIVPRPWTRRPSEPQAGPQERRPVASPPGRRPEMERERPAPVVKPPVRRPEIEREKPAPDVTPPARKPVVKPPVRRPEIQREKPKPAVEPPARRTEPPKPRPVTPPPPPKKEAKDDGGSGKR